MMTTAMIGNLQSVTSEINCVTSSVNTRMTSTGCPAVQPTTTSSAADELSTEADSNNMPEFTGSQSL